MRIASLDPGYNTGVAIAIVHETEEFVTLEKYNLVTLIDEPAAVAELVISSRCKICLMEAKPHNAADSKWVPNTLLQSMLPPVVEIKPGAWKPFMRSRLAELESWNPETQHEKDAMAMLYYFVQAHIFNGKKVLYV
jgi:hypothetical protein